MHTHQHSPPTQQELSHHPLVCNALPSHSLQLLLHILPLVYTRVFLQNDPPQQHQQDALHLHDDVQTPFPDTSAIRCQAAPHQQHTSSTQHVPAHHGNIPQHTRGNTNTTQNLLPQLPHRHHTSRQHPTTQHAPPLHTGATHHRSSPWVAKSCVSLPTVRMYAGMRAPPPPAPIKRMQPRHVPPDVSTPRHQHMMTSIPPMMSKPPPGTTLCQSQQAEQWLAELGLLDSPPGGIKHTGVVLPDDDGVPQRGPPTLCITPPHRVPALGGGIESHMVGLRVWGWCMQAFHWGRQSTETVHLTHRTPWGWMTLACRSTSYPNYNRPLQ